MELLQLKYFVTIAETLSYTSAAEILHVSQPALSYQMRRLEQELGTSLFRRAGRRIMLTPDGETFLPLAQAVLFRADEAVRVLREHLGMEAGEVRLGCNPSVATYVIPRLLASFRQNFPRVRVQVIEGGDMKLQQQVVEGTVDFAIVTAPGSLRSLEVIPLLSEELMLVVPVQHRFAGRSAVGLAELISERFVFPTASFNAVLPFVEACRRLGFEPRVAYQTSSAESVMEFVRHGLGIAVQPRMVLANISGRNLVAIPLQERITRDLNLLHGKDRALTATARALIAHIRSHMSTQTAAMAE